MLLDSCERFVKMYGLDLTDDEQFKIDNYFKIATDLRGDNFKVHSTGSITTFIDGCENETSIHVNKVSGNTIHVRTCEFMLRYMENRERWSHEIFFTNHSYRNISNYNYNEETEVKPEKYNKNLAFISIIDIIEGENPKIQKKYECWVLNSDTVLADGIVLV